jgi:peptidoglycan/xylan/chitin deacetylase (PgdA/CDA1 family)
MSAAGRFWPGDARLAVTVSMQFEAGGQPISGAPGPVTEPIRSGYPDLPQNSFYEYGIREGIPRMLDLFDRHRITVTSFMIGEAVDKQPQLAHEIVRRGHEAAAHGRRWENQYLLGIGEERAWITDGVASIERATRTRPRGYNNYWMRGSVHTLELLQRLGLRYHIDDLSADEPFIQELAGGLDRFLTRARQRADVWWARRDQIAEWALVTRDITPTIERLPAEQSGLPGDSSTALS